MAAVQQGVNDLYTWCLNNGEKGQRILKEWTGIGENGKIRDIHNVAAQSGINMLWKCSECSNEFYTLIRSRTIGTRICKLCTINKLKPGVNDLKTWCENNGAYGNQLIQEWTGLDKDDNKVNITKITYGSSRKVKWKCKNNHTWIECIAYRTCRLAGCTYCSKSGTSYPEQFIYWTLKQLYPNTENRCRVLKSKENPQGIEFDIGVPDIPLCIEYSPTHWHNSRKEQDNYKKSLCKQRGIRFIQIIDDSYNELNKIKTQDYICLHIDYDNQDKDLILIVEWILESLDHSISEIDLEIVKDNAWKYSHGEIEYEKSLAYTHPELAKEWHPTLNTLKPTEITYGNNKKFYWQCINCNYGENGEWQAPPLRRTAKNYETGCPCCGYHWKDRQIHKTYNSTLIMGINDLATTHPELAKEWHPTLNTLKPAEIKAGHSKIVYWQCTKCGYGKRGEWRYTPNRRTGKGYETGCPQCGYNWHRATIGAPQRIKAKYRE